MTNEILYVSTLSSKRLLKNVYECDGKAPFAVQKFGRLIATGFFKNDVKISALSNPVISSKEKKWVNLPKEVEDGISYNYVPFFVIPVVKHIMIFCYSFFYVIFWGVSNRRGKTIVCDVLKISICMGALLASKLIGIKSVGVVTDMPGLMVNDDSNKQSLLKRMITKINKSYLSHFSSYVFLTEAMNNPINKYHRPYIIMEGLVDSTMQNIDNLNIEKSSPRTIIYAGGLHARYGLKMLCEAFITLPNNDIRLKLYGNGAFVEELQNDYCKRDSRIKYMGIRPNEEVINEEYHATLLVNPRPTTEEFTKYSFPSKNMEYMLSGTPLLTTKLSGMPDEYYPYVYLFEEESVKGYSDTLANILNCPADVLNEKGKAAKNFVLNKKNNIVQSRNILNLILSLKS